MRRLLIAFWALVLIVFAYVINVRTSFSLGDKYYDEKVDFEETIDVDLGENIIEQEIKVDHDNFDGVMLYFSQPDERHFNDDYTEIYVKATISDQDNRVLDSHNIEYAFWDDGRDCIKIRFPEVSQSSGEKYILKIEPYNNNFDHPVLKLAKKTDDSYGKTTINGEESSYGIVYQSTFYNPSARTAAMVITVIVSIIILIALLFVLKIKRVENIYFVIALVCGVLMVFVFRPFFGYDEADHLARIYDISNGNLFPTRDAHNWPVAYLPSGFMDVSLGNYKQISDNLGNESTGANTYPNNMEYTGVYSPLSYLYQIPVMWLARIITNRPVVWTYIMRIGQLLISVLLIREIIKRARVGQKIIFVTALLPAVMDAVSFVSADTIFTIACLAMIVKVLNMLHDRSKLNRRNILILSICSLFVAIGKLMFFPLIFCLYLIPMSTQKKKDYLKISLIIAPILVLVFAWSFLASSFMFGAQGANAGHQISHYLANPIELVQVMAYSLYHSSGNHLSDLFGGNNAWYGPSINDGSLLPITFAAIFVLLALNEKFELTKRQRWLVFAIVAVEICCIAGSMLLVCMPPFHNEIVGIQGRYFTMLLPFAALLLARKKNNISLDVWRFVPMIIGLSYLVYIFRIIPVMCGA